MTPSMPATVWVATIALIAGLLLFDFVFHVRKAHRPTTREAAGWSALYISVALLFGVAALVLGGREMGTEYFAGYVTEWALSVDNLFVFLIIMGSFSVPRALQQKVLLFGISFSLLARGALILAGAAMIETFSWTFYLFGLILLVTAGNLLRPEGEDAYTSENFVIRAARRLIHTTDDYDGDRLITHSGGRRAVTPLLLVMVAIGGTDILFALDSIPAIFGLTDSAYVVFTATAFSLLGLRQLYFLIDGLLDRLIYLAYGLALILGFIGVKLVLHALHGNNLSFINDGQPVPVAEISTPLSLIVIVAILIVTVTASLRSERGKALSAINTARRRAERYLDLHYESDPRARERSYARLVADERRLKAIPEAFRHLLDAEHELHERLAAAHAAHRRAREQAAGPAR